MRIETATPDELLDALRAEGIDSYDRLVAALLDAAREAAAPRTPMRWTIDVLAHETPPHIAKRLVQRVPKVGLTVDGIGIEPAEISRFDGRVLHFIAGADGALSAFTDGQLVSTWLRLNYLSQVAGVAVAPPGDGTRRVRTEVPKPIEFKAPDHGSSGGGNGDIVKPTSPGLGSSGSFDHPPDKGTPGTAGQQTGTTQTGAPATYEVVMYEHAGWHGAQLVLQRGRIYDDLTSVGNGFFGSWNDLTSSLSNSDLMGVFGEHMPYANLGAIGWNDRISSALAG